MPSRKRDLPEPKLITVAGSPCFYIAWSIDRRSKRISTGTADRTRAETKLAEFKAGLHAPPPPITHTVSAIVHFYLQQKKASKSPKHYKSLEYALKPILDHFGAMHISLITRAAVREYVNKERKAELSPDTTRRRLSLLIAALNYVRKEGWIASVPPIEMPPKAPPKQRWLTKQEAKRLIAAAHCFHTKLFIIMALTTGARKGAIFDLTWDRVDIESKRIDFNPPGKQITNKRRGIVPINKLLMGILKEAREIAQTDYVVEFNGKPITDLKQWRNLLKRANLKDITPHTLRHTAATWLVQGGVSMEEVGEMLGHKDPRTTSKYVKYHKDYLVKASKVLEKL